MNDELALAAANSVGTVEDSRTPGHQYSPADQEWENDIRKSMLAYGAAGIARLDFYPMPTIPAESTRRRDEKNRPLRVPSPNPPPFDIFGWTSDGRFVGALMRFSATRQDIMTIRKPGGTSYISIPFDQLDALAHLAMSNGIARVIWNNAGELCVLGGPDIVSAHQIYLPCLAAETNNVPRGALSIKSSRFNPVNYNTVGNVVVPDWLNASR